MTLREKFGAALAAVLVAVAFVLGMRTRRTAGADTLARTEEVLDRREETEKREAEIQAEAEEAKRASTIEKLDRFARGPRGRRGAGGS